MTGALWHMSCIGAPGHLGLHRINLLSCFCAATKDHREVQGEILEGLVVRLVSPRSIPELRRVIQEYPLPITPEMSGQEHSLRDIYRTKGLNNKQVRCRARLQGWRGLRQEQVSRLDPIVASNCSESLQSKGSSLKPLEVDILLTRLSTIEAHSEVRHQ